jgi:hypothetical protein
LYLRNRQGLTGRDVFAIDGVKQPSNASKCRSVLALTSNAKSPNSSDGR